MKGHPTVIVNTANRIRRCMDEDSNDIQCHIFVAACPVERRPPIIISITDSGRKIFEKASHNSLGDSFIVACLMEGFVFSNAIIIDCQSTSLNYFMYAFL